MFALEVRLNGELKATCGTEDIEFLGGALRTERTDTGSAKDSRLLLECVGVRSVDANTREVLKWVAAQVRLGDEVSFRFVDAAQVNAPIDRQAIPAAGLSPDA